MSAQTVFVGLTTNARMAVDKRKTLPVHPRTLTVRRGPSFPSRGRAAQLRRRDMTKAIPAFGALVVALALIVPTVSQAAQTNSVRVSYADLNLASPSGANVLERRIASAARVVCEIEDSRELALATATMTCRDQAVSDAQPAFNAALLAARNPSVTVLPMSIAVTAR
jgi:UrcA family protein